MPIELGEDKKKTPRRRLSELKPQRENAPEAKPAKTPKKQKNHALKQKPKKNLEYLLGGKKGNEGILSLTETPQYTGNYELLKPLGPVFGTDLKPQNFVSRIWAVAPNFGPVIEMKSQGPYHDPNSRLRPYGMVEKLQELALTLQFYNTEMHLPPSPEVPLRELKAGHNYQASGWVVTKADIDEGAGKVSINIAKEKEYRIMSLNDTIDTGDFKVKFCGLWDNVTQFNVYDADGKIISTQPIEITSGDTYTFTQSSTGKSIKVHVYSMSNTNEKWAEVAILSEEHTLTHGQRYDGALSDDPNWKNWWVAAGTGGMKKDGRMDYTQGIDFSSNTLSIYCDDTSTVNGGDNRFKKGDTVQMPLGYELRCDGPANDWKNNIHLSSYQGTITLGTEDSYGNWDGNTRGGQALGPFIKLLSSQNNFFINPVSLGGRGDRVTEVYVDPLNHKVYGRPPGNFYFIRLDGETILGDITDSADPLNRLIYSRWIIGFDEMARHNGTPNVINGVVTSSLSFELEANGYKFKKTEAATSVVIYKELNLGDPYIYELPMTTERGSQWTNIGTTDATFEFNVGGNEPGITDGMARFKWSVLDHNATLLFENAEEPTDGRTKNGIDERWRYPERYIIPSKFNSLYQDGIEEFWALSQEGTVLNFIEQDFENRLDYFALKIRPKDQWVERVSKVPIMGKEYTLGYRDVASEIWTLLEEETGTTYQIQGQSISKFINGQPATLDATDPFYGFKPYIGDCAKVKDITNPDLRTGNDVLWLKKNVDTFIADAGPQAISSTASMRLDQQPRTQSVGLEIVKDKDFGPTIGTMDAFKINLQGWEGANSQMAITNQVIMGIGAFMPLKDGDEIYYVTTYDPAAQDLSGAKIIVKLRVSGKYEAFDVQPYQNVRFYKYDKDDLYNATNQVRLSHRRDMAGDIHLTLAEPLDKLNEETVTNGYPLVAETEMVFDARVHSDQNGTRYAIDGLQNQASYSLKTYHVSQQSSQQIDSATLETHTGDLTSTKYNAKGTEIAAAQYATGVTFALYDNDTYPTRFSVQEEYAAYQKMVAQPITAPLEYTDGGTKIGYLNYDGMPWLTYPVYPRMPSDYFAQFQANVLKSQFDIFCPLGTQVNPNSGTISITVLAAAYHLALEHEPQVSSLTFLFNGTYKLLQQPPTITDFVPLPSNSNIKEERGTKMYGVLGSAMMNSQELLDSISDEGTKEKLREYIYTPTIKAWAVQDDKNVYLVMDGLPVLKMRDWTVMNPDDPAVANDPLCKYVAVFGEGTDKGDLRDVTNGKLDKDKAALWMLPLDLFGTTYAPGERMEFPGGPGFTLSQKAKDAMRFEIVEKQFPGMNQAKKMYHLTMDDMGGGEHLIDLTAPVAYPNLKEVYLWPKASISAGLTDGLIFDVSGNVIYDFSKGAAANFGIRQGNIGMSLSDFTDFDSDGFKLVQTEGSFAVGSDSIQLSNNASFSVEVSKDNGAYPHTYLDIALLNDMFQTNGTEKKGGQSVSFDAKSRSLGAGSPLGMENGTSFFGFGDNGHGGVQIFYHSNSDYPVFWSKDEQFISYKEGDPMAGWKPVSGLSSYVNAYPNPVSRHGTLTLELESGIPGILPGMPGIVDIGIYDLLGKPVGRLRVESLFAGAGQKIDIDMNKLDVVPGVYIFRMHPANNPMFESRTRKVIVTE